jgi:ribosome-associated protein
MIRISPNLQIDESELRITFVANAGPGGQNVNKLATRAVLQFDVATSPSLTDPMRERLLNKLSSRISREGILRVTAGQHRTQLANRRMAIARFSDLLAGALKDRPPRTPTKPTRASRKRRRDAKVRQSTQKRLRRGVSDSHTD